jgi:hypothetical protein
VKLVTDKDFQVRGKFKRVVTDPSTGDVAFQTLETSAPLVRGDGKGRMVVANIPLKETKLGAAENTPPNARVDAENVIVTVDDPDWPINLRGQVLGEVESVQPMRGAPLYAEIRLHPTLNLAGLSEVMVLNKLGRAGQAAAAD